MPESKDQRLSIPATEPKAFSPLRLVTFLAEFETTMTTNDPDRIVTVRIFDSLTEAITARAMLEAAEIDCFLADEHTYRIAGPFHAVFGINGVRLQVRAEDLERAATMLESPPGAQ